VGSLTKWLTSRKSQNVTPNVKRKRSLCLQQSATTAVKCSVGCVCVNKIRSFQNHLNLFTHTHPTEHFTAVVADCCRQSDLFLLTLGVTL
jgi:hypothetical protein